MHRLLTRLACWPKRIAKSPAVRRKLTLLFHRLAADPKGRKLLSRLFGKTRWYYLMLAHSLRKQGDDHGSFRTLMLGQRSINNDCQLHIKLSELYRDNGDVQAAHTHLRLAELLKPGYTTIRRLSFETDHGMFADGTETMARVLELAPRLVQRHMTILNRVSIHYPEHAGKLDAAREELKTVLRSGSFTDADGLSQAVETAISNRWLTLALDLGKDRMAELDPATRTLLERLRNDLGAYPPMLDLAWRNETAAEPEAIVQGKVVPLKDADTGSKQIVELFIPTPFFASPDREKPTYGTIRQTFVQVIRHLLANEQVIVVPRFQLYWKQCIPRLQDAWIVSYHTFAPINPRHLHIQESPLAGCCSFDHSGFAGYSSIATDHAEITRFVAGVSDQALEENQRTIHDRYVAANVSKYQQPAGSQPIPGPYVFVALQIPTDIVSRLAWISGTDLLRHVVEFYRGKGVGVVVKRHPFCGSMGVQKCLDELEAAGEIIRTDNSIHSIIASAELILTVNSGVGLEALMHGKTVVVSGGCDYSYAAKTVRSRDELFEVLAGDPKPDLRRIRELLYYYSRRFTVAAADADQIRTRLDEWLAGGRE